MKIERLVWYKHFLVLGAVPGLLKPRAIAVSEASSTNYRHEGRKRSGAPHSVVFQYTLAGCGAIEVNGVPHSLPAGKGFCSYVEDPHIVYFYPKKGKEAWRFIYIDFCDELGVTKSLNAKLGYVFEVDIANTQIRRLLHYEQVPDGTIEIRPGAAHHFLSSLIGMLADETQSNAQNTQSGMRLIRQAMQVIEDNIHVPFNASMLAHQLGISPEHLSRIYRAEVGQTPYQCICQSKMYRACEQLKNTSRKVSEIAVDLGYEPGSHFARLFKRIIGVTPRAFRQSPSLPLQQL